MSLKTPDMLLKPLMEGDYTFKERPSGFLAGFKTLGQGVGGVGGGGRLGNLFKVI